MKNSGITMRKLIRFCLVVAIATPALAVDPAHPAEIKSPQQWVNTLAMPQHKGTENCFRRERVGETKGIYIVESRNCYQPKTQSQVKFEFNSSRVDGNQNADLDNLGAALQDDMKDAFLRIEGHADNIGADDYNQRLSERRADAVKQYLVGRFGIEPERLYTTGFGKDKPQCRDFTSESCRAHNRRVEFRRLGRTLNGG